MSKVFDGVLYDNKNVVKKLPPGAEYNKKEKKIEINQEKIHEDTNIPGDKRTFEVLKTIANSIDKDVQVTIEVLSDNEENKLPCTNITENQ